MKPIKLIKETVITDAFETESLVKVGSKIYLINRHFLGRRDVEDAISAIVKNEAVRKTV